MSLHTSPLHQPGVGDAGGMNVYVLEQAKALGALGHHVHVFTRASHPCELATEHPAPGVWVHALAVGPPCPVPKEELPALVPYFVAAMAAHPAAEVDVAHAHYWLSAVACAEFEQLTGTPWVSTMHTLGAVKNASLTPADQPEPSVRLHGEYAALQRSHQVFANTHNEAHDLTTQYDVAPNHIVVVPPGVDTTTFKPVTTTERDHLRADFGLTPQHRLVLFVGRIQALKGPDVLLAATKHLIDDDPTAHNWLRVFLNGGSSGNGPVTRASLETSAADLTAGTDPVVVFGDPVSRTELAKMYQAADVVAVPSHHETFGLVAVEAQACGTPVVAAARGGLLVAVEHDHSGLLIDGHTPQQWAHTLRSVLTDEVLRARLGCQAVRHAQQFSWAHVAERTVAVYRQVAPVRSGVR